VIYYTPEQCYLKLKLNIKFNTTWLPQDDFPRVEIEKTSHSKPTEQTESKPTKPASGTKKNWSQNLETTPHWTVDNARSNEVQRIAQKT